MSASGSLPSESVLSQSSRLRFCTTSLLGLLLAFVVGCGGSDGSGGAASSDGTKAAGATGSGGTLHYPLGGDPTVQPFSQKSPLNDWAVVNAIYDTLVRLDPETQEPQPELATSWESERGGRRWTFKLQDGVTWHDGEPFTAEDVKFTIEASGKDAFGSYHQLYFKNIEKVTAVDDLTVQVDFAQPRGNFLNILAYNVFIAPKHLFDGKSPADAIAAITKAPVGTGPFKYASYTSGSSYVVEANKDYFAGSPSLDRIEYKIIPDPQAQFAALQAGELDWAEVSADNFQAIGDRPGLQTRAVPINRQVIVTLNHANPLFESAEVRRGLAMAIDRPSLLDALFGGHGHVGVGPIMPVFDWAYPKDVEPLPFDPDGAKELLSSAGWTDSNGDGTLDKDGKPFEFDLIAWESPYAPVLDILVDQWSKIGVKAKVSMLDVATAITEVRAKKYAAALYWWDTPLDPDVGNYYATDGVSNIYNYENPGDDLLRRAVQKTDQDERAQLYGEFQELMRDEQPVLFLFYPDSLQALSDKVGNVPELNQFMIARYFDKVTKGS